MVEELCIKLVHAMCMSIMQMTDIHTFLSMSLPSSMLLLSLSMCISEAAMLLIIEKYSF
jgi:hypothetical protein